MDHLQFIRKGPRSTRRISIGADLRAIATARRLREEKAIQQARIVHERWLANRATVGIPDLVYLEAARIAIAAEAAGKRLRREIHALALEERLQAEVPVVRPPLRPPLREPEPSRIEYSPATAAWLARRHSQ